MIALGLLTSYASAQNFEAYRPQTPPNQEGEATLPDVPKAATGDPTVLVKELKSLVFVDHKDKLVKRPMASPGVHIESTSGLNLLRSQAFYSIAEPYIGGPVSLRRLNELTRKIIIFYRNNDQPVVDVSIPQQDITEGVVQIVITEGRVGKVRVKTHGYFDPCMLANQTYTNNGGAIYESWLLWDLEWLNRNPFREVDMELTPGKEFGETDVVFNVYDRLPWRAYLGYEDTGTDALGLERTIYGLNWGNALGRDHQASYQYTASSDFSTLQAHSGAYQIPMANRDVLLFYGSYAMIDDVNLAPFNQNGVAWQASVRWQRTLCDWGCYKHQISAGFDFKQTNTDLEFGGVAGIVSTSADIAQIALGYYGSQSDSYGAWLLGADAYLSPGGFSPGNNDTAYQQLRFDAQAEYYYSRMFIERQINLNCYFTLVGRLTGQIADGNLLASEQLGFGGYNSVRGYDMRLVNGDQGYLANIELRTNPVPSGLISCDQIQGLLFYDYGDARNHTLAPGETPSVDLNGVGAGIRYSIAPTFALRADYGIPLNEAFAGSTQQSRFHIGAVLSR